MNFLIIYKYIEKIVLTVNFVLIFYLLKYSSIDIGSAILSNGIN